MAAHYCHHGEDHYSYATCIRTTVAWGGTVLTVGNLTHYSRTTSKHQSFAEVRTTEVHVFNVPRGVDALGLKNLAIAALSAGKGRNK